MPIKMLRFDAFKVAVTPASRTLQNVTAYEADGATVLANFSIKQIVTHYGARALLNEIGITAAYRHFEVKEEA